MSRTLLTLLACLTPLTAAFAQPLPFGAGWELTGASIRVERTERGEELVAENGTAYRRDVSMRDGTIDVDVKFGAQRSFVYVSFRMADDDEYEEFYIRTHKPGLPDTVQYAPVRQRHSGWQLFHGPGYTAPAAITPGVWTPVRVVVSGRQSALFIGDMTTPVLVAHQLRHDPRPGYVSVRVFTQVDPAGPGAATRYANFRVSANVVPFVFPVPPAAEPPPGKVITEWAVSEAGLPANDLDGQIPKDLQPDRVVRANAEGLLELHQWLKLPAGSRAGTAVAQVVLESDSARTVALDLGFSDIATVFLNGRPLFRGDGRFSADRPRRDGLIGFDNARLYLPLAIGTNTLTVVVSDSFGGWGLMAALRNADGVAVRPR